MGDTLGPAGAAALRSRTPVIESIRVPTFWNVGHGNRITEAVFKLGAGPCGLTVTKLELFLHADRIEIAQTHSDGGPRHFMYPVGQLTGRIETRYVA